MNASQCYALKGFLAGLLVPKRRMETRPVLRCRLLPAHDAQVSEANSDFRVSELDAAHPGCIPMRRMGTS